MLIVFRFDTAMERTLFVGGYLFYGLIFKDFALILIAIEFEGNQVFGLSLDYVFHRGW